MSEADRSLFKTGAAGASTSSGGAPLPRYVVISPQQPVNLRHTPANHAIAERTAMVTRLSRMNERDPPSEALPVAAAGAVARAEDEDRATGGFTAFAASMLRQHTLFSGGRPPETPMPAPSLASPSPPGPGASSLGAMPLRTPMSPPAPPRPPMHPLLGGGLAAPPHIASPAQTSSGSADGGDGASTPFGGFGRRITGASTPIVPADTPVVGGGSFSFVGPSGMRPRPAGGMFHHSASSPGLPPYERPARSLFGGASPAPHHPSPLRISQAAAAPAPESSRPPSPLPRGLTLPQAGALLQALRRLAEAASRVAVRGVWFALHTQGDGDATSATSSAPAVVAWGPSLHDHTIAERLGCAVAGGPNPWGRVHTVTWGTLGPHSSQRPTMVLPAPPGSSTAAPAALTGAATPHSPSLSQLLPAAHDWLDSGLLHAHAQVPPPLLTPLPLRSATAAPGAIAGGIDSASLLRLVAERGGSAARLAPLPLHAALLRLLATSPGAPGHGSQLAGAPLPQLTRALSSLLADPVAVVAHASWLAAAPLRNTAPLASTVATGPGVLWLALALHPGLAPLSLRTKLFNATAFGVRRSVGWLVDQQTAARNARRTAAAAAAGGSGGGSASRLGPRDPLAADEQDGDEEDGDDDDGGARYGGYAEGRVMLGRDGVTIAKQRAMVSRRKVLSSALALFGPRPSAYTSGAELLEMTSDGRVAFAPAGSSSAGIVGAAGSTPASAFAPGEPSTSSSSSPSHWSPTNLPTVPALHLGREQSYALAPEAHIAVQFSHEAGHGTGPTVEFFALSCAQLQQRDLGLWLDSGEGGSDGDDADGAGAAASAEGGSAEGGSGSASSGADSGGEGNEAGSSHRVSCAPRSPGKPVRAPPRRGAADDDDGVGGFPPASLKDFVQPGPGGLHPLPLLPPVKEILSDGSRVLAATASQAAVLRYFDLCGRVVGKALSEDRIIDLPLSEPFVRAVLRAGCPEGWPPLGGQAPTIDEAVSVAPSLGRSLRHLAALVSRRDDALASLHSALADGNADAARASAAALSVVIEEVDALCLDFTFPGQPGVTLTQLPTASRVDQPAAPSAEAEEAMAQALVAACGMSTSNADELLATARACAATTAAPWYALAPAASTATGVVSGRFRSVATPAGSSTPVTAANLHVYLGSLLDTLLGSGVALPAAAFHRGLAAFMPAGAFAFASFTTGEVRGLLCGGDAVHDDALWAPAAIAPHIIAAHGYRPDSPQVTWLLEALSSLSPPERRLFLRFVMGAPRLPVGGWGALSPRLTVVRAVPPSGVAPDDLLPTCNTCQLYFKQPAYSSKGVLRAKLLTAIREGQEAFSFD